MQTTQPIKNKEDIQRLKQYYLDRHQVRNYALFTLGINTSLRIGDLLTLTWGNVYDFQGEHFCDHIRITEQKTRKYNQIALNHEAIKALTLLKERYPSRPLPFSEPRGTEPAYQPHAGVSYY